MYKITCNDVSFLRTNIHNGAEFKGVAFTDNKEIADEFKHNSLTTAGNPLFEVEEVEKEV